MRLQPTQEETAFWAQLRSFFRTEVPAATRERVRAGIEPSYVPRWRGPDGAAMSACAAMSLSGEEPTAKSKENE